MNNICIFIIIISFLPTELNAESLCSKYKNEPNKKIYCFKQSGPHNKTYSFAYTINQYCNKLLVEKNIRCYATNTIKNDSAKKIIPSLKTTSPLVEKPTQRRPRYHLPHAPNKQDSQRTKANETATSTGHQKATKFTGATGSQTDAPHAVVLVGGNGQSGENKRSEDPKSPQLPYGTSSGNPIANLTPPATGYLSIPTVNPAEITIPTIDTQTGTSSPATGYLSIPTVNPAEITIPTIGTQTGTSSPAMPTIKQYQYQRGGTGY